MQGRRYSFDSDSDPDHPPHPYDGRRSPTPKSQLPSHLQSQQPQQRLPQPQPQPQSRYNSLPQSTFDPLPAAPTSYARESSRQQGYEYGAAPLNPSTSNQPPPPAPPPHRNLPQRDHDGPVWLQQSGDTNTDSIYSNITPGADNFGDNAAGGLAAIAMGIADANARESGLEAMRNTPPAYHLAAMDIRGGAGGGGDNDDDDNDTSGQSYQDTLYSARPAAMNRGLDTSQSSLTPLGPAAFPPGLATPQSAAAAMGPSHSAHSSQSLNHEPYVDDPYNRAGMGNRYSRNLDASLGDFDPNSIEDDGDDGLDYGQHNRSTMSFGNGSDNRQVPAAGVAGGAAAAGILGAVGGIVGRKSGANAVEPQYNPVGAPYGGAGMEMGGAEKSAWAAKTAAQKRKKRMWIGLGVGLLIVAAIVGGIVGGIVGSQGSGDKSKSADGESAGDDSSQNGDLNIDSAEIQALMNNKGLHKVFPGIDYTPMYTQYPDCLTYPASQNNVTRDLAVLSQLTNTIRLYGTDCNQTELLLHSIDQLKLQDTIKVWMGVWQDTNTTTNSRQLAQMYDIFKKYGGDQFKGVIVGNEVLFRKDMTAAELGTVISGVRSNLTSMGISIPVASSDLGDDWTAELAAEVDIVMANIHPFFAGVSADVAAAWTWDFWQTHDVTLKSNVTANVISETGWPSTGGTDCGGATSCTNGSVAGITEMNTFMADWVCSALTNGTDYFWFEAFDEPWKIKFDTAGEEWEDKWGLMDVNRNLKDGVTIPDCGGQTVDS